jgi:hypothetical protein
MLFATLAFPLVAFAGSADQPGRKRQVMVPPAYPELAKLAPQRRGQHRDRHSEGRLCQVNVVKVIGGHPVLADAAVNAVNKWRYQPGVAETKDIRFVFQAQN